MGPTTEWEADSVRSTRMRQATPSFAQILFVANNAAAFVLLLDACRGGQPILGSGRRTGDGCV
jgi:hypothetical protein